MAGAKRGGGGGKEKSNLVPRVLSNPPYGLSLRSERGGPVGQVGENPGNEVGRKARFRRLLRRL